MTSPSQTNPATVADLLLQHLAADELDLVSKVAYLAAELRVVRELVSVLLDQAHVAHQRAIAHDASISRLRDELRRARAGADPGRAA